MQSSKYAVIPRDEQASAHTSAEEDDKVSPPSTTLGEDDSNDEHYWRDDDDDIVMGDSDEFCSLFRLNQCKVSRAHTFYAAFRAPGYGWRRLSMSALYFVHPSKARHASHVQAVREAKATAPNGMANGRSSLRKEIKF